MPSERPQRAPAAALRSLGIWSALISLPEWSSHTFKGWHPFLELTLTLRKRREGAGGMLTSITGGAGISPALQVTRWGGEAVAHSTFMRELSCVGRGSYCGPAYHRIP